MSIIEHFFRVFAPHQCVGCGNEGDLLCRWCSSDLLIETTESCYRCNRLSPDSKTCASCRTHSVLKHVWRRANYDGAAKELVHKLKFDYARDAAKVVAREMAPALPYLTPDTIVVHVPATTSHVRIRGFDQSALIARELSKILGLRHIHALARIGQQRQVGSSNKTRRQQMEGAFRPLAVSVIKDSRVLLIDDVLTTGSTLEAAARTLRQAGAASVDGATFAQAK